MSKVNMIFAGLEESKATNFKLIKPKKKKEKRKKIGWKQVDPWGQTLLLKLLTKFASGDGVGAPS